MEIFMDSKQFKFHNYDITQFSKLYPEQASPGPMSILKCIVGMAKIADFHTSLFSSVSVDWTSHSHFVVIEILRAVQGNMQTLCNAWSQH